MSISEIATSVRCGLVLPEKKKLDIWLTCNFPNWSSCPNKNSYFCRLIYNISDVEDIQIQNLHVPYVLVGRVRIYSWKKQTTYIVWVKIKMLRHNVRKRRQPDTDFLPPWLKCVMSLINLSTTCLHQLYFLIFPASAIAWKARTHKGVFEVGHKNELIANSSQYHNHNVSLLFFPFPNNQLSALVNDGALWSFSWLKTL